MANPAFGQQVYYGQQQYAPGFVHYQGAVQPPPNPVPPKPPANLDQKMRVDKFIAYLIRVGPDFEAMLREKQQANPEFAFLFGGPDHAYYQWRTWCMQNGWTEEQVEAHLSQYHPLQQDPAPTPQPVRDEPAPALQQPGAVSASGTTLMSSELESEFFQFLQNINGAKDTIKNGRRWMVKNSVGHEARIAELIAGHMLSLQGQPFDRKLHVVYLLNDILHAFLKKREVKTEVDPFSAGLGPHLLAIFDTAFRGHSAEEQDKIVKVVRLWGQRDIYPEPVVKDLESKMRSDAMVVHYPSQPAVAPTAVATPPLAQQSPPLPMHTPQSPHPAFQSGPQFAPNFNGPRPSPFPLTPPTSTLHLGPGFIVTLTKDLAPYQPLDPLKVPSHIPPEYITPPDAYTLTRLDKFYAEINEEALRGKSRKSRRSSSRSRSPRKKRTRSRSRSPPRLRGGDTPLASRQFAAIPPPKFK